MFHRIRALRDERDKGFTLIELLVVIIIIGILAAVAIPIFLNQRKKAVDAGIKSDVRNAATAVETYSTEDPTATTLTMADVYAAGFELTTGNTVDVTGSPATGYCVLGWNSEESDTHNDRYSALRYDSLAGGLNTYGGACTKPRKAAKTTGTPECGFANGEVTITCSGYSNQSVIGHTSSVSQEGLFQFSLQPVGSTCDLSQGWTSNASNPVGWQAQPQQFVVCGGVWQGQAEYLGTVTVPGTSSPAVKP